MNNLEVVVEMEKKLYVAAENGDIEFLQKTEGDEYLSRKTSEKNNILHIAVRNEQHDFIKASISKFPNNYFYELVSKLNFDKNTPLHIAAEVGNLSIFTLLFDFLEKGVFEGREDDEKLWRVMNLKGNTPIHVAIIYYNVKIARFLLDKDPSLAEMVNNSMEAPLHLAIKHYDNYHSESESIMSRMIEPVDKGGVALAVEYAPGEDMSSMIHFLVEKWSLVTCWPDTNGYTPLHSAASLKMLYNIQLIKLIIYHCPQSAEVCDNSGNTILHLMVNRMPNYGEGKEFLKLRSIYNLRNHQDRQGNTPLHVALRKMDVIMVRVLLESSTKLNIKNVEGDSASSLIQQHNLLEVLTKRKFTKDECEAAEIGNITFLLKRMNKFEMDFLRSKDSNGRNILHILMQIKNESYMPDDFEAFIEKVVAKLPSLLCQTDDNGDTPIHVLVRNRPETIVYLFASGRQYKIQRHRVGNRQMMTLEDFVKLLSKLLEFCHRVFLENQNNNDASAEGEPYQSPWLVQNADGNTPLHEALITNNKELVRSLLIQDPRSVNLANKCKQTPLHLLVGHLEHSSEQYNLEEIKLMVEANVKAKYLPDQRSLTPLYMKARQSDGKLTTFEILCGIISLEMAKTCDTNGQTFCHVLVKHPSVNYFNSLLQNDYLSRDLLRIRDTEGNTPLHLAIESNQFGIIQKLFKVWECRDQMRRGGADDKWLMDLLDIQNNDGETPADLIGEVTTIPHSIEKIILCEPSLMGIRSSWNIPKSQFQTYMNTIGIIAALLTTITFTVAFNVPGGLLQDNGTPVLMRKKTFQMFIVSDVIAMCLSMMVLLCLLWIMGTTNKRHIVMIQDFSASLLLQSFFATIFTFMAGVYATTFNVNHTIGIFGLVSCSLLLVLVNRSIIMKLLIPLTRAILIFNLKFLFRAVEFIQKRHGNDSSPV